MKIITSTLIAAGAILTAAPAMAQSTAPGQTMPSQSAIDPTGQTPTSNIPPTATAPATAPAETVPAVSAADISDADVSQFARAVVALDAIQKDTALSAEDKQTQMAAKVQEHGLEPTKFNAIAQTAQSDPELQAKVQSAIQAETGGGTMAAPTN